MHGWTRAALGLVIAVVAAACDGPATGMIIDGFAIGRPMTCDSLECRSYPEIARGALDKRDPGHAAIFRLTMYDQANVVDGVVRGDVMMFCSGGCPNVAVFELADGTVRAIGVGTPGIATVPITFDHGSAGAAP